jgi:hypothetical protein
MRNSADFEYDVCLSFAGEDRDYVQKVADSLRTKRIRVFYDEYEEVKLWGKDLYVYLDEIYRKASRYCVLFISTHYANKLWANHERQSAQARAFTENQEYILPARFDDTEIPGLRDTVAYIDLRRKTPQEFAELVACKIEYGSQYQPSVSNQLPGSLEVESDARLQPPNYPRPGGYVVASQVYGKGIEVRSPLPDLEQLLSDAQKIYKRLMLLTEGERNVTTELPFVALIDAIDGCDKLICERFCYYSDPNLHPLEVIANSASCTLEARIALTQLKVTIDKLRAWQESCQGNPLIRRPPAEVADSLKKSIDVLDDEVKSLRAILSSQL